MIQARPITAKRSDHVTNQAGVEINKVQIKLCRHRLQSNFGSRKQLIVFLQLKVAILLHGGEKLLKIEEIRNMIQTFGFTGPMLITIFELGQLIKSARVLLPGTRKIGFNLF